MRFSGEVRAKMNHLLELGLEMVDEQKFESSLDRFDFMLTVRWKNEKKRFAVVRFELIEHVSMRNVVVAGVVIDESIGSTAVRRRQKDEHRSQIERRFVVEMIDFGMRTRTEEHQFAQVKIDVWTDGRRVQMQLLQHVRSNRGGEGRWKVDGLRIDVPCRVDDLVTKEASHPSIGMVRGIHLLSFHRNRTCWREARACRVHRSVVSTEQRRGETRRRHREGSSSEVDTVRQREEVEHRRGICCLSASSRSRRTRIAS